MQNANKTNDRISGVLKHSKKADSFFKHLGLLAVFHFHDKTYVKLGSSSAFNVGDRVETTFLDKDLVEVLPVDAAACLNNQANYTLL